MKINNISTAELVMNQNGTEQAEKKEGVKQESQEKAKTVSIKGSELNLFEDPIEEKKKKAKEEAMSFIKNQFKSDGKVDGVKDECRNGIQESKAEAEEASRELVEIRKQKEELDKQYTDHEDEEYLTQLKSLNEEAGEWQKQYEAAHASISANTAAIRSMKQEELKYHGMVDANKAAEVSRKASSDEIVGMLKDEAIDKIDEDMDEVVEEAQEKKEEKIEQEAEQEKVRAEREKQAQEMKGKLEEQKKQAEKKFVPDYDLPVDYLLEKQREISRNTQEILEQQKMLAEEIKGIAVDFQI